MVRLGKGPTDRRPNHRRRIRIGRFPIPMERRASYHSLTRPRGRARRSVTTARTAPSLLFGTHSPPSPSSAARALASLQCWRVLSTRISYPVAPVLLPGVPFVLQLHKLDEGSREYAEFLILVSPCLYFFLQLYPTLLICCEERDCG